MLIKAGADVNARDGNGETPLGYAALTNPNPDMTAALIKAGADVNGKDNEGMTKTLLGRRVESQFRRRCGIDQGRC